MVTDQRTKPRQITPCRLLSLSNIFLDISSGAQVKGDLRDGLKIEAQQHFQFFITLTAFSLSLVLDGVAAASWSISTFAGSNVHLLIVLTISV